MENEQKNKTKPKQKEQLEQKVQKEQKVQRLQKEQLKQKEQKDNKEANERFMALAIKQAKKGLEIDEVPIGAVVVVNGEVISKAFNKRQSSGIATHHAEILAIEKACKKMKDWRLENGEIYVTLEPCPMCAGAIANARISKLYYGAFDKSGTNKQLLSEILSDTRLNHKVEVEGGILETECQRLITSFFQSKRKSKPK